jgi:imidazolonepropionase-like amidohydrolase
MLESKGEERKDHWVVRSPEDASEVVARIAAAGMDCVKLRTFLDEKTYLAIAAAADEHKLMLTGHAPEQLDPELALKAGQRTFEHAFYPYPLSKLTEEKRRSLFSAFKASRAAVVPTLIAWRPFTEPTTELEKLLNSYRTAKDFAISSELLDHWERTIEVHRSQKRGSKGWQDAVATASSDIGQMHAAGVTVLPGSDSGAPFVVPGLSLHEELYLLAQAVGMTPAEVLSAATIRSAAFYGREKELGSIEKGKIADFIILNNDPLKDIENTRDIEAVVFRGEALTQAHLNMFRSKTKL